MCLPGFQSRIHCVWKLFQYKSSQVSSTQWASGGLHRGAPGQDRGTKWVLWLYQCVFGLVGWANEIFFTPEWIQQYKESFIQPDHLQKIVDSFMENYDKRKEEVRLRFVFSVADVFRHGWLQLYLGCDRKQSGRRRRLRSSRRMKKAGWKLQGDTRGPKPVLTVRQPTEGLWQKRWRKRSERNSWTSTPGSTETLRKSVSTVCCKMTHIG